jgi:uncharacterized protein
MVAATHPPIGWPLLPLPDEDGRLGYPDLAESVRQTIRAILSTRPGEQLMRPDFGAGLELLLHEPNSIATRRRIRELVQSSLERWERRILLDRVEVWEIADEPTRVRIEVAYRLARSGEPGALAATMQLEK